MMNLMIYDRYDYFSFDNFLIGPNNCISNRYEFIPFGRIRPESTRITSFLAGDDGLDIWGMRMKPFRNAGSD